MNQSGSEVVAVHQITEHQNRKRFATGSCTLLWLFSNTQRANARSMLTNVLAVSSPSYWLIRLCLELEQLEQLEWDLIMQPLIQEQIRATEVALMQVTNFRVQSVFRVSLWGEYAWILETSWDWPLGHLRWLVNKATPTSFSVWNVCSCECFLHSDVSSCFVHLVFLERKRIVFATEFYAWRKWSKHIFLSRGEWKRPIFFCSFINNVSAFMW